MGEKMSKISSKDSATLEIADEKPKEQVEYTDDYLDYLNMEIKSNFAIADDLEKEMQMANSSRREAKARAFIEARDRYEYWKQTGKIEYE